MSSPSYHVKCAYRVFSKIHEGGQLEKMRDQILTIHPHAIFGEETNNYWPIRPEIIDDVRGRGILVTEKGDDLCLIIQELPITISVQSALQGEEVVHELNVVFPNSFATMSVCAKWLTEVIAV